MGRRHDLPSQRDVAIALCPRVRSAVRFRFSLRVAAIISVRRRGSIAVGGSWSARRRGFGGHLRSDRADGQSDMGRMVERRSCGVETNESRG